MILRSFVIELAFSFGEIGYLDQHSRRSYSQRLNGKYSSDFQLLNRRWTDAFDVF